LKAQLELHSVTCLELAAYDRACALRCCGKVCHFTLLGLCVLCQGGYDVFSAQVFSPRTYQRTRLCVSPLLWVCSRWEPVSRVYIVFCGTFGRHVGMVFAAPSFLTHFNLLLAPRRPLLLLASISMHGQPTRRTFHRRRLCLYGVEVMMLYSCLALVSGLGFFVYEHTVAPIHGFIQSGLDVNAGIGMQHCVGIRMDWHLPRIPRSELHRFES
jgi:hypothetical protein